MTTESANRSCTVSSITRSRIFLVGNSAPIGETNTQGAPPPGGSSRGLDAAKTKLTICRGLAAAAPAITRAPIDTRTPSNGEASPYVQYTAYGAPGGPSAPAAKAPSPSGSKTPVQQAVEAIISEAKRQSDPELRLQGLDQGYEATRDEAVKKALLANSYTKNIIAAVANDVNKPFTEKPDGKNLRNPIDAARFAVGNVYSLVGSYSLRPAIISALLNRVFQGHEEAYAAVQNGRAGFESQKYLAQLLFTAGTPQGKQAAARLAEYAKRETDSLIGDLRHTLPSHVKNEFENLIKNTNNLQPQTRLALLSQIENYHNSKRIGKVIHYLILLAVGSQTGVSPTTRLFRNSSLAYQQRYAKVIAYHASDGGDPDLRDKTLDAFLDPSSEIAVIWAKLTGPKDGIGDDRTKLIELDPESMRPGNDVPNDDRAIDLATETLSHELSHIKNHVSSTLALRTAEARGLARLKHELCAGYVGVRDRWGVSLDKNDAPRIFSQRDAYVYFKINFIGRGENYADIKDALHRSLEARLFVAKMIGLGNVDPDKVTFDYLANLDPHTLSTTEPALLPKEINGVPYNFDNH